MTSEHSRGEQLERGVRIGDFEIEKRLGAGGMGIVYQARQVSLGRRVALKVLGSALRRDSDLARFQREAQAIARLKHHNIAGLHFLGQDGELCYHVMEFIDGVTLRTVLERLASTPHELSSPDTVVAAELTDPLSGPCVRFDQPTSDEVPATPVPDRPALTPSARKTRACPAYTQRCCEIVRDAARALDYAHGEGVVHRDVKPENLMLDTRGQIHIIDFGLARFFDDVSITNTGQLVGTPLYMSPEQVTGHIKADHRSDVYSVGMVLYEMLTLRPPIPATSRENLLRNIVTKALPPLCARNPAVPRALESVVHKATHKDPEERYQSAADLADDLERFLNGKAVSAPAYRYRRDMRETVASRPGAVVLAAFLCFLSGFCTFLALMSVATMMAVIAANLAGYAVGLFQGLLGTAALLGTALLAWGMLSGWGWARWIVIVLASAVVIGAISAGVMLAGVVISSGPMMEAMEKENKEKKAKAGDNAEEAPEFPASRFIVGMALMYAVPALVALLCGITVIVSLLRPSTGAWFRLAAQSRREHRMILEALRD